MLEVAHSRLPAVVVTMPDYSWICERGTCIDSSGIPCLPAVTPGSCACRSGTDALAARNASLRAALRPDDVALIPPTLSRERLVASGIRSRVLTLDAAGADSVSRLHAIYRDAAARRQPSNDRHPPAQLRHVLFIVGASGSPLRYRVHQKVEQLAIHGISSALVWYADPRLPAAVWEADAVIVYRAPATRLFVEVIRSARRRGVPTFWDVDDLIFDPATVDELPIHRGRSRKERDAWIETAHRYRAMLLECGAGIASTPEIARHMGRIGVPAQILPNGVDTTYSAVFEGARRAAASRKSGVRRRPFTIGYCSGSDTHDEDFEMVGPILADFLDAHREARMLLVGPLMIPRLLKRFSRRIQRVGWLPGMEVPRYLTRFDLNIAPLVAHDFTNGKSAIKWSEAALVGVPTLAWATEPFRMAIDDGRTGLLANDTTEFRNRLEYAFTHRAQLPAMAEAARLAAFEQGSPWVLGERLTSILETAERAAIREVENRWPVETYQTDVEEAGTIAGLAPRQAKVGPGERLDGARVAFSYPLGKGALRRADVQIASWLQPVHSPLELRVRVGRRVLASATVPPKDMVDNGWVAFTFDPPVPPVWGAVAELCSDRHQNIAPYVMRDGSRYVNGVRVRGAVMARTFHQRPVLPDFSPPAPAMSVDLVKARLDYAVSAYRHLLRREAGRVIRRIGVHRSNAIRPV